MPRRLPTYAPAPSHPWLGEIPQAVWDATVSAHRCELCSAVEEEARRELESQRRAAAEQRQARDLPLTSP